MKSVKTDPRQANSLLELLIVIGVIGILVGLVLPAVQSVRSSVHKTRCQDHLRQIGIAFHNYHSQYGHLPGVSSWDIKLPLERRLSWYVTLLPMIEQDSLYRESLSAYKMQPYPFYTPPHFGNTSVIRLYVCPSDGRLLHPMLTPSGNINSFTSYLGISSGKVTHNNKPGIFSNGGRTRFSDVTDGTSTTIMVGERTPPSSLQAGQWYNTAHLLEYMGGPNETNSIPGLLFSPDDYECSQAILAYGPGRLDNPCDRYHFWSLHFGGANFVFADGSVRFLPYSMSELMPALATISGGEIVEIPN